MGLEEFVGYQLELLCSCGFSIHNLTNTAQ